MKKCGFLSPEALLQAEIFSDGQGGSSSGITDVSGAIMVNTGGRATQNYITYAYYNNVNNIGLFWVQFTPLSSDCFIGIDSNLSFFDIISSNNTAYIDNNTIKFNEVSTDTNIIVSGKFKFNNQEPSVY